MGPLLLDDDEPHIQIGLESELGLGLGLGLGLMSLISATFFEISSELQPAFDMVLCFKEFLFPSQTSAK